MQSRAKQSKGTKAKQNSKMVFLLVVVVICHLSSYWAQASGCSLHRLANSSFAMVFVLALRSLFNRLTLRDLLLVLVVLFQSIKLRRLQNANRLLDANRDADGDSLAEAMRLMLAYRPQQHGWVLACGFRRSGQDCILTNFTLAKVPPFFCNIGLSVLW